MSKEKLYEKIFSNLFFLLRFISKSEFFCILILLYIIVLFTGTIEQKNFGLHFAQDVYFNSIFVMLFNKIPMLGGKTILCFVFISLFLRLIMYKWKKKRIGTILLHSGVLFLLFGAFVSSNYCFEGIMVIKENEYNNSFVRSDLYDCSVFNKNLDFVIKKHIGINSFKSTIFNFENAVIKIFDFSYNSNLSKKYRFLNKNEALGVQRFFDINKYPSFVEQEENKAMVALKISFNNHTFSALIIENNEKQIFYETDILKMSLLKKNEVLPFNIYLSKFDKLLYPGTDKAKNYISHLVVEKDDGIMWKNKLEMNKPLRISNYTFYQTSYINSGDGLKSTILTVVNNTWSFYPYISIALIFFGFVLHLILSIKKITKVKND